MADALNAAQQAGLKPSLLGGMAASLGAPPATQNTIMKSNIVTVEPCTDEEIEAHFNACDVNGNGFIDSDDVRGCRALVQRARPRARASACSPRSCCPPPNTHTHRVLVSWSLPPPRSAALDSARQHAERRCHSHTSHAR